MKEGHHKESGLRNAISMPVNRIIILLFTFFSLFIVVENTTFTVLPKETECFQYKLETGDNLSITYHVLEGGNLDIDFTVCSSPISIQWRKFSFI